jgi:hypothetical protein
VFTSDCFLEKVSTIGAMLSLLRRQEATIIKQLSQSNYHICFCYFFTLRELRLVVMLNSLNYAAVTLV